MSLAVPAARPALRAVLASRYLLPTTLLAAALMGWAGWQGWLGYQNAQRLGHPASAEAVEAAWGVQITQVAVTAGGSTDDFATDELAYRIPSIRRSFGNSVSGMELVKPGWMLEPNHAALVGRMKWIAAHRDEAKKLGRMASEQVRREWTWERAAQIAAGRLVLLSERPRPVTPAPVTKKPKAIELPPCAKLGHLGEARELFRSGKLLPAWNATAAALMVRPYHPEAFLLLAEIALAAGDSKQAKELGERACRMAPAPAASSAARCMTRWPRCRADRSRRWPRPRRRLR